MYENEKKDIIKSALLLKEYKLISLSGGNVSVRTESGQILMTPSGMFYDIMVPEDIVTLNASGNILEGTKRPSVDMEAILYILNKMPNVNAVIHTHQVYATAVGLVQDILPAVVTTLVNATLGPVEVAPFSSAASLEMGINTVKYINNKKAVILKNHGVVTVGETLKEALYSAIYLEDAAKTYIMAKILGDPLELNEQQIETAARSFQNYGQK